MMVLIAAVACRSGSPPAQGATGVTPAQQAREELEHPRYTPAGVQFASGMIMHHAQAILMAGWAPTHDASPSVQDLCKRIAVSQTDEIKFMQDWLRARRQPVPDGGGPMAGMLMPGMLTHEQLAELDRARGPSFDRLFLTDMIQHHQGAIEMVHQLASSGQGEDNALMVYATNVEADQSAEIGRMQRMLATLP